jgi:uncharacterized protein
MNGPIQPHANGVHLLVRLTPKAKKDEVGTVHDGRLKISVTSPPIDGRANEHLVKLLSKALKIPKRDIKIASGETSRDKALQLTGIDFAEVKKRLSIEL